MATAFPATRSDPPPAKTATGRLLSLDVFRGLTILAMILVNNPGQWGEKYQYWPLDHAEWHGWTPTDLIFPFFLFIVGTSLAYSLRRFRDGANLNSAVYLRIIRRTATLIFLGWMPTLLLKTIAATHGQTFDLSNLRIFGVLVRIALVYFFTSLIVLNVPLRRQVALGIVLLLGYWATLAFLPNPYDYNANLSNEGNVTVVVDRALVGDKHMYHGDPPTEPEGFLSTFPAIVSALIGYWTGLFIQRRGVNYRTVALLAACGLAIAALGQGWHYIFPINKKLWTSSFVLLTGGLAMIALAACLLIFDIRGWRRLARPFEVVGINAIFVFVCSGLLSILLSRVKVGDATAHAWIYHSLITSHIHDPKLASLGMALLTVAFWWFVCWLMSQLGWAIRV
jgi:predicted acyltransferase